MHSYILDNQILQTQTQKSVLMSVVEFISQRSVELASVFLALQGLNESNL